MNDPIFELSSVTRRNGAEIALNGVSATMRTGEVVGVIGPNGAGKSTLMRLLLGLIPVHSGEVRVFGLDPWKDPVAVRRRIGYASDGRGDDSRATIRELHALHSGLYPRWDGEFAQRLLGPLAAKHHSRIDRLSRGEAQRVRISLAMAHRPDLLLLDEPGAGLDPSLRREFLEDAVELLGETDTSIVINSHHLSDIVRIASRILLMNAGSVLLDVELDSLQERYCIATLDARHLHDVAALTPDAPGVTAPSRVLSAQEIPTYVGHRARNGEVRVVLQSELSAAQKLLGERGLSAHLIRPNLEELYVVLVGGNQ